MPEIYVDADSCPVKAEVMRVAERHSLKTHMVSNAWMRLPESPLLNRIIVGDGFDAADDWIAGQIGRGDIAITSDIPLADRCIKAGGQAIAPNGKPFSQSNIGSAMAMRDLMAHLRDTGEVSGHNPSFTKQDRSRFLNALENAVQAALR